MNILFRTGKLEKVFNDGKRLHRQYGPRRAKLIGQRLYELHSANVLSDLSSLPGTRCHELKGDRSGQLSVDLDHPYRLVFEPADNPVPRKADGGLDWTQVTVIRILEVEDTHE